MDDSHGIVVKEAFKIGGETVVGFEHQYLRYYYDSSID